MTLLEPTTHRFTFEEYMQLSESSVLKNPHTELIDGEIIDMAAQKDPHAYAVSKINRLLVALFPDPLWLKLQATVQLDNWSAPEPDFAVMSGPPPKEDEPPIHPLLFVEVSDTTVSYDRRTKSSLYAAHAVPDYWLVNLNATQVEVHRDPVRDSAHRFGWRYASVVTFKIGDTITPLAMPGQSIEVARMLP